VSWAGIISRSPLSTVIFRGFWHLPCVGAPRTMRGVVRIGISTAVLMGLSASEPGRWTRPCWRPLPSAF